ncbi:MAG: Scr1 family TA system antitoxin-like transcriptional regulator [Sciscionella sp.]
MSALVVPGSVIHIAMAAFARVLSFTPGEEGRGAWILHREGDQLGWWERYSDVLPDNVEMLAGFEDGAGWVRQYDEAFVPVLLQTPEYAHAIVTSAAPYQRSADMPRIVEFRQQRQEKLRDSAFRCTAIVNEGALRRHVGGGDVMCEQLRLRFRIVRVLGTPDRDQAAHERVQRGHEARCWTWLPPAPGWRRSWVISTAHRWSP